MNGSGDYLASCLEATTLSDFVSDRRSDEECAVRTEDDTQEDGEGEATIVAPPKAKTISITSSVVKDVFSVRESVEFRAPLMTWKRSA